MLLHPFPNALALLFLCLLLAAGLLRPAPALTMQSWYGYVTEVIDASTILVQAGSPEDRFGFGKPRRIRLIGIRGPAPDTPMGREAKAFLEQEFAGRQLLFDTLQEGKNGAPDAAIVYRYNEPDAQTVAEKGLVIYQEELLRRGYAQVTRTATPHYINLEFWKELQREAKAARLGIWAEKKEAAE